MKKVTGQSSQPRTSANPSYMLFQFKDIGKAYAVFVDEEKRKLYDAGGEEAVHPKPKPKPPSPKPKPRNTYGPTGN